MTNLGALKHQLFYWHSMAAAAADMVLLHVLRLRYGIMVNFSLFKTSES